MPIRDYSKVWEDTFETGFVPHHVREFVRDSIQAEDDSYRNLNTLCISMHSEDIKDLSTLPPSAASICTLAILAETSYGQNVDTGILVDTIEGEDDSSDEYPLAIEVKTEKIDLKKEPLYQELYRVYRECCESDWDGYGADPINEQTFLEAMSLLDQLPSQLPLPEVVPEPAGNIAFEWYKGKKHVYVISVCGKNKIEYAGLFGRHSKTYGAEYFSGDVPDLIISNILRLFS